MINFYKTLFELFSTITNFAILSGLILSLSSITISVYKYFKKKQSLKYIKKYFLSTLGIGILLCILGLLVNYIAGFDIDFRRYSHAVPVGYFISLLIYFSSIKNHR